MKFSIITSSLFAGTYAAAMSRVPQACAPLKSSRLLPPVPNTAAAFRSLGFYNEVAEDALAPSGYERVVTAANASVNSDKYMSYSALVNYDVSACARHCDASRVCNSFNIYIERTPSVDPAADCPNPPASVSVLCGLYSEPVVPMEVQNSGQGRGPEDDNGDRFEVVIRGSNVYNKINSTRSSASSQNGTDIATSTTTIVRTSWTTVVVVVPAPTSSVQINIPNLVTSSTSAGNFTLIPDIARHPSEIMTSSTPTASSSLDLDNFSSSVILSSTTRIPLS